jgi:hypothetical protein
MIDKKRICKIFINKEIILKKILKKTKIYTIFFFKNQ